jgi:hypothetical protein
LPTLWDYWARKISLGTFSFDEMALQFDLIREAIYKAAEKTKKCFWELVPANCFYDEGSGELMFFDQEYFWENRPPDLALSRAIGALVYSPVFSEDPRRGEWLSCLIDRYGLADRWGDIFESTGEKTYFEVFGKGNSALEAETWKAGEAVRLKESERSRKLAAESEESRMRQDRFSGVPVRLLDMGVRSVIIYGHGKRGKDLKRVLISAGIAVAAMIDKNSYVFPSIETAPPGADAVIISILNSGGIEDELRGKTKLPIYMLKELLDG